MQENSINPKNGIPFYEPFTVEKVDPSVLALQKSPEDKDYYVLYYNLEFEEYKWKRFTGRYDAYFGIKEILETESIDVRSSVVIVETVGIDPSTNKGKRYLNYPDNSSSILEFCHYVEKFFGDNAYDVDQYDTGPHEDIEEEDEVVTESLRKTAIAGFLSSFSQDESMYAKEINQANTNTYFSPIVVDEDVEERKI